MATRSKSLTPRQRDLLARQFRLMAGRCFHMLHNGVADRSNARGAIKRAHDVLCETFRAIEES